MKINIRNMRSYITIEYGSYIEDDAGGYNIKWQRLGKCAAEVQYQSDYQMFKGELVYSMQVVSHGLYRFIIRFLPNLPDKIRVTYEDKIFNVTKILNYEQKNQFLILIAEEGIKNNDASSIAYEAENI